MCCVSGETGKHDAIRNVVEIEGVRADIAFVYGNRLGLALGNRGRVDKSVTVHGPSCHCSRPHERCNAVTGAVEVIQRLPQHFNSGHASRARDRKLDRQSHAQLSGSDAHGAGPLRDRGRPAAAARRRSGRGGGGGRARRRRWTAGRSDLRQAVSGHGDKRSGDAPIAGLDGLAGRVGLRQVARRCSATRTETFFAQSAFDQGYLNRGRHFDGEFWLWRAGVRAYRR